MKCHNEQRKQLHEKIFVLIKLLFNQMCSLIQNITVGFYVNDRDGGSCFPVLQSAQIQIFYSPYIIILFFLSFFFYTIKCRSPFQCSPRKANPLKWNIFCLFRMAFFFSLPALRESYNKTKQITYCGIVSAGKVIKSA